MTLLRHVPYHKTPNARVISAADFKSVGVEDQTKVTWDPANHHTAEVSEAAASKLQELEPNDWEVVESSDATSSSGTSSAVGEETQGTAGTSTSTRQRTRAT